MQLQEAVSNYLLVDRATSTRNTYRKVLTKFADYVGPARPLDRITPEDLDRWIYDLRQITTRYANHPSRPKEEGELSERTVYKRIRTVKSFLAWCVRREYLAKDPARFIEISRPQENPAGKAIDEQALARVLGAARYKPRDWAIICLLVQSGCRAGEAAGLLIDDLDLFNKRAWIRKTKTDEPRFIYFDIETVMALQAYLEQRPDTAEHNHVFVSTRGHGSLSASSISQMIRRRCQDAGLDRTYGAHSLRHRAAVELLKSGLNPQTVKSYLGHKRVEQTLHYGNHVYDNDLRDASHNLRIPAL